MDKAAAAGGGHRDVDDASEGRGRRGQPAGRAEGSSGAKAGGGGSLKNRTAPEDPSHTVACERGGLTMIELMEAMKKDALEQESLMAIICELVSETVQRNDARNRVSKLTLFEGEVAPIPAIAYVTRIRKYGGCSECCFVVGLIYLERLKKCEPSVCLTSKNFQRLLLVAVMVASKFLDDFYYSNKHWAEIGGLETAEINYLELEFLFRIAFSCTVQRSEYMQMAGQLRQYMMTPSAAAAEVSKLAIRGQDGPADEGGSKGKAPASSGGQGNAQASSGKGERPASEGKGGDAIEARKGRGGSDEFPAGNSEGQNPDSEMELVGPAEGSKGSAGSSSPMNVAEGGGGQGEGGQPLQMAIDAC